MHPDVSHKTLLDDLSRGVQLRIEGAHRLAVDVAELALELPIRTLQCRGDGYSAIVSSMHGGVVIREARRRAGLSQRALAERLGTDQSVVGRWEALITSPTFEAVAYACAACGFGLDWVLQPLDADQERVLREQRRRTPAERVASAVNLVALRSRRA